MIYTVTLMDEFKDERNAHFSSPVSHKAIYWMADHKWTAGYFTRKADAINAVKNNEAGIFEDCYNYAVVEAFDEGVYPYHLIDPIWFRYDYETNQAYEIDPPVYNQISSYAF